MSRSWLLYLDDLIESAEKIGRLVAGHTFSTFVANEAVFDAVLFNLQIIGEAIKRLPDEATKSIPAATLNGAARLRDLIAHHYFAIDAEVIWEVATQHVPPLRTHASTLRDRIDAELGDSG